MDQRDGWKHDDDGWYGDVPEPDDDGTPEPNPYRTLPPRTPLDELVAESDAGAPPYEPTTDPNREVANRWGAGIAGF